MSIRSILHQSAEKRRVLAAHSIVPDSKRCVQCGICSFNCPLGVDVRMHAILGKPVVDYACLTCGECVRRCPRGVLKFEDILPTLVAQD